MENQNNQNNQNYEQYPNQGYNPQFQQAQQTQQIVNQALADDKKKRKKKKLTVILIIVGVLLLIGIVGAIGGSGDDSSTNTTAGAVSESSDSTKAQSAKDKETVEGQIGDYVCTVKSAEKCKDWSGKDAIKITYSFTNNSKDAESFDLALTDEAYQDGIGLETTFLDGGSDELGLDVKVKPGTTKEVSKIYLLRDDTTKIDIEISELVSFSDDKLTYEIDL